MPVYCLHFKWSFDYIYFVGCYMRSNYFSNALRDVAVASHVNWFILCKGEQVYFMLLFLNPFRERQIHSIPILEKRRQHVQKSKASFGKWNADSGKMWKSRNNEMYPKCRLWWWLRYNCTYKCSPSKNNSAMPLLQMRAEVFYIQKPNKYLATTSICTCSTSSYTWEDGARLGRAKW